MAAGLPPFAKLAGPTDAQVCRVDNARVDNDTRRTPACDRSRPGPKTGAASLRPWNIAPPGPLDRMVLSGTGNL